MRPKWEYISGYVNDTKAQGTAAPELREKLKVWGEAGYELVSCTVQSSTSIFVTLKRQKATGVCGSCEKPVFDNHYLCDECREQE